MSSSRKSRVNLIIYCWYLFYYEINSLRTCLSFLWLVKDPRVVSSYLISKEIDIYSDNLSFVSLRGQSELLCINLPKKCLDIFDQKKKKKRWYTSLSQKIWIILLFPHTNCLKKICWWFKSQKWFECILMVLNHQNNKSCVATCI